MGHTHWTCLSVGGRPQAKGLGNTLVTHKIFERTDRAAIGTVQAKCSCAMETAKQAKQRKECYWLAESKISILKPVLQIWT